jgi:hypothetical protein
MTDDEIVALGSFCETLMCHPAWAVVVEQFEQHCFQQIMTTEPHEQKKREGIYKTNYCSHRLGAAGWGP